MTVMVSMKTFTAREPDHRAMAKPREMTSGRPPVMTSSSSGWAISLHALVGQDGAATRRGCSLDGRCRWCRARPVVDVAEQPDQAEQQRRQRQQGEERRLGGQSEDAVLHAGVDGVLEQQPGHPALGDVAVEGAGPVETARGPLGCFVCWLHLLTVSGMAATTHTVTNQAPPLVGYDVFAADRGPAPRPSSRHVAARAARRGHATSWATLGRAAGSAQAQEWGEQANENPPVLRTHDRYGHRIDEVEFHPAWHRLLGHAVAAGLTDAWAPAGRPCAARRRLPRVDAGRGGPRLPAVDDPRGGARAARRPGAGRRVGAAADLARCTSRSCGRPREKAGALFGMGMTEKQGGSDVRANTTRRRAAGRGRRRTC